MGHPAGPQHVDVVRRTRHHAGVPDPRRRHQIQRQLRYRLDFRGRSCDPDLAQGARRKRICGILHRHDQARMPRFLHLLQPRLSSSLPEAYATSRMTDVTVSMARWTWLNQPLAASRPCRQRRNATNSVWSSSRNSRSTIRDEIVTAPRAMKTWSSK